MATTPVVVNPLSQGKMKALWDAVRSAPSQGQEADPAVGGPQAVAAAADAPPALTQKVAEASMGAGPVAAPNGGPLTPNDAYTQAQMGVQDPGVAPVAPRMAPMAAPLAPALTLPSVAPDITEVGPKRVPASDRVDDLQAQVDAANHPSLTERLLRAGIPLAIAGASALAGGQGGAGAIGVSQAVNRDQDNQLAQRKLLTEQLGGAQTEREKEFDTAQRTVEAANAAHEANRTRDTIARTLAGSREGVAETTAGARRDVATTQATSRDAMADIAAAAARYRADKAAETGKYAADQHVVSSHYAADAAANRQSRSIAATDDRQQAGFTHTDDKPTAAEDQRADLADGFKQYAKELRDIAVRRPELFGPLAGRLTEGRNSVGSSDPDIAAIARIKEQGGTLSQAAHSLRNAGHIATASDKAFNIHQSAQALIKNIDDGNRDIDTFQTIHRPTLAGRTAPGTGTKPAAPSGGGKKNDPLGIL